MKVKNAVLVDFPSHKLLVPEAQFQALFGILTKCAIVGPSVTSNKTNALRQMESTTCFKYGDFDVETLEEQAASDSGPDSIRWEHDL